MQNPAKLLYGFTILFYSSFLSSHSLEDLTSYQIARFKSDAFSSSREHFLYQTAFHKIVDIFNSDDSYINEVRTRFYEIHCFKNEEFQNLFNHLSTLREENEPFQGRPFSSFTFKELYRLSKNGIDGIVNFHISFSRLSLQFQSAIKAYQAYLEKMKTERPDYTLLWSLITHFNTLALKIV